MIDVFQIIISESGLKQNKIWLDKGGKFYNKLMKSWLQDSFIQHIMCWKIY